MKTKWFIGAWSFIVAVALLDAGFAWVNRASMTFWEMNPAMCGLAGAFGPTAAIAVRLLTVVFALVVVGLSRKLWRAVATSVIGTLHFGLLMVYAAAVI